MYSIFYDPRRDYYTVEVQTVCTRNYIKRFFKRNLYSHFANVAKEFKLFKKIIIIQEIKQKNWQNEKNRLFPYRVFFIKLLKCFKND